ncbi:MAG: hypothetical protein ACPG5P_08205 [Saprospiraceae bacterium]
MKSTITVYLQDDFFAFKISAENWELNIKSIPKEEIELLEKIQETNWAERKTIQVGLAVNAKVFWCFTAPDIISILVGQDDETWDMGVNISLEEFKELLLKSKKITKTK